MAVVSTDFAGPALDPALATYKGASLVAVTFAGGRARFEPVQGAGGATGSFWFDGNDGFLVYYEITGDFDAVLDCAVRDEVDDVSAPPVDGSFRIAGIAAHDPDRATNFDYVHCGFGATNVELSAEWKTTVASVSTFGAIAWPSTDGQLRIERVGQLFNLYCRLTSSDPWTLLQAVDRTAAPLPATLQVGVMAYASDADHEIVLLADNLTITTPASDVVGAISHLPEATMDTAQLLAMLTIGSSPARALVRTPVTVSAQDTAIGPAPSDAARRNVAVGGFLMPANDCDATFYSGDPATTGVAISGAMPLRAGVPFPLSGLVPNAGERLYMRRGSAVAMGGFVWTVEV